MVLYTFGTPNGHKLSILLEELGLNYQTKVINITKGDQKDPEFLKVNPNGKIPAFQDDDGTLMFESVAIMIYLAEKYGKLLPVSGPKRAATLSWSLWQAASLGPMMGQFGHFNIFATEKVEYGINRYRAESERLLAILEAQLAKNKYVAGEEYSIADIAIWPWIRGYQLVYKEKIEISRYPALTTWYTEISERPAVKKAMAIRY